MDRAAEDPLVAEAIDRGIIEIGNGRITYHIGVSRSYAWTDPEEWVRARTIGFLIIGRHYPANRICTEVAVPRRIPSDRADIVVYRDDSRRTPWLVVENKSSGQGEKDREQGIEQAFGNANSLRASYALYDECTESRFYDVGNFPGTERRENLIGDRTNLPAQYGDVAEFSHIAGQAGDIAPKCARHIELRVRKAHSIIWSGGKRDPLTAFDEWSKLLFAKVADERTTQTGKARRFQAGRGETTASVANRIHRLFLEAAGSDPTIFADDVRIDLPDRKIYEIVRALQAVSFTATDVDHVGVAFESFFGSVFRGELGQYFTMRPLARFTVAMLDIDHTHFVLDPTAGSGGFLLEVLLQVWQAVERGFRGQPEDRIQRIKTDFALRNVYGIEIHEILARICKINLLLHHDGHTNIEGNRSCLDMEFRKERLALERGGFRRIVGNPPFGDEVREGDADHLGSNTLSRFEVAEGRSAVVSEHVILERSVRFLEEGGKLGLVVPDGLLNNQGEKSNCPRMREFLARNGYIEAIVSLPDYAFRKSGATNKTSILFFRKFTAEERRAWTEALEAAQEQNAEPAAAISNVWTGMGHRTFFAEADHIGYTPTGTPTEQNDLYRGAEDGGIHADQAGTILGEYRRFVSDPKSYDGGSSPNCLAEDFGELWSSHSSHRLDPKYFLFKRGEKKEAPSGWVRIVLGDIMRRRDAPANPGDAPDRRFVVMTLGQNGEIRRREEGKGRNPPEWLGMYFAESKSTWYAASAGDVVFSSIDLWKGCIAVVPREFDGAMVTAEYPIYEVLDERLDPEFLACLLRSRYYQRAFRAITTGHSNRRRTQREDFEALEICFPEDRGRQIKLIAGIIAARNTQRKATERIEQQYDRFSAFIEGAEQSE